MTIGMKGTDFLANLYFKGKEGKKGKVTLIEYIIGSMNYTQGFIYSGF